MQSERWRQSDASGDVGWLDATPVASGGDAFLDGAFHTVLENVRGLADGVPFPLGEGLKVSQAHDLVVTDEGPARHPAQKDGLEKAFRRRLEVREARKEFLGSLDSIAHDLLDDGRLGVTQVLGRKISKDVAGDAIDDDLDEEAEPRLVPAAAAAATVPTLL